MLLRLYRRLLPFARPYRGKMVLASIMNILSNAVGSVNLLALLPIVSVVLGDQSMTTAGSSAPPILQKFTNLFIVRNGAGALDTLVRSNGFAPSFSLPMRSKISFSTFRGI